MEGKVCTKCGKWKPLDEFHDRKDRENKKYSACKECVRERCRQYRKNNIEKIRERESQYRKNNKEHVDLVRKQWRENNKEKVKESRKQYKEKNKEKLKEQYKQYREKNKNKRKEYEKRYRENNKEKIKQWRENNKDYSKNYRQKEKDKNIEKIKQTLTEIKPIFIELNLPIYGYIYKFENTKTGRVYIGQTIQPLNIRYYKEIIKKWIRDRKKKKKQKFKEELIEEDIEVTEVLDVACCQYHLNILEADYIEKYDSCNNGYNNNAGHYKDDTGIEEFEQILKEYGIIIEGNKIIKINRKQKTEH